MVNSLGLMRAPNTLLFGAGQRSAIPDYVKTFGKNVLIVTDARMQLDDQLRKIRNEIEAVSDAVAVFDGVAAELPLSCIDAGLLVGSTVNVDVVVAIGGGSCIDAAKVISLLLKHGGSASDYYGEFKVPGSLLPVIAVPTTSGTGSEVTPIAVLDDPSRATKIGIASPYLIPAVSICDPELTVSCPRGVTVASGADALTHAIESFITMRRTPTSDLSTGHVFVGSNALSNIFSQRAIELIAGSLETAVENGPDIVARSNMMLGATLAGLAFGVTGTGAAHAIQYPVGALTHTAHGVGVAALMPYVMAWNRPACEGQLAEIGKAMGLSQTGSLVERATAAIRSVRELYDRIGIPATIADLGVQSSSLDAIVSGALSAERLVKNSPRKLDRVGMARIVKAAFHGELDALLVDPT